MGIDWYLDRNMKTITNRRLSTSNIWVYNYNTRQPHLLALSKKQLSGLIEYLFTL